MILPGSQRRRSSRTKNDSAASDQRRRRRLRPVLMALEGRTLLSTFTVTKTTDDGSPGTLRYEIAQVNAAKGNNTIVFSPTVFATHQTITLSGSELELSETTGLTTITGPAAGVTIDGNRASRDIVIDPKVTASITGLTITGGVGATPRLGSGFTVYNYTYGGGVFNYGNLTLANVTISGDSAMYGGGLETFGPTVLTNCVISGNTATNAGGGVGNEYPLAMTNCTISNNVVTGPTGLGGGVADFFTASLTGCTISGNSAFAGGGLANIALSLTLTDCTISGNSAAQGGGVDSYAIATLTNVTISGNSAALGGGLFNIAEGATLNNTIVAGNFNGAAYSDITNVVANRGATESGSNNLIGTGGSGPLTNGIQGNVVGVANPDLAPLGNYGGPTQTMALLPGSPAIGAGSTTLTAGQTTDQRGDARTNSGKIDIGAFESRGFTMTDGSGASPQTTHVTSAFGPLAVTISSAYGEPVQGGVVTFNVTNGSNGAGASLSSSTATIDGSGLASVAATANAIAGSFTVTASATGTNAATFSLTSTQTTPVITWANPADITYGTALSGTQLDATANVPGTFTYTPAAGTVPGAGIGQTLSVSFVPADTTDYSSATATAEINVAQATPVITWANPADITYGTALCGTQLDASANVPGTFTYSPAAGTVLGAGDNQTLSVSFVSADTADYTSATAAAEIKVAQATPVITWANPADITYGTAVCGTQLDATANVPGTFMYAPTAGTVLGAGTDETLSVSFVPADMEDYTDAKATAEINVAQATPVITWANPADITYGTALSGTQLDASANVPGTFTYTPAAGTVLGAGDNQTLSVSFVPADTADYTSATAAAEIKVAQATPVITWANPADITYGTALCGTQLDATANVPGTFMYAPTAGTVLGAGTDETLSVSFVPTDMEDYTDAKATAEINVAQATPVITWANPADITYGTALCGTQLDATANVPGTFTYTPAAGTVLGAGDNQTLSVSFVPADTTDYTSATATAEINVGQAMPVITWANPADITYGTALSGTQLDASASVPGTFTYAPAAGTVLGAGDNQTLSVNFVPADTADYMDATATAEINVAQATPVITWGAPADITYGTALCGTQLDATANVPGTFTYTPAAGTVLGAGDNQTLSVSFVPADAADYTDATATAEISVAQATPVITWANPADITYGTALSGTQLDAAANVPGTFTYAPAAGTVLGAGDNQTLSVSFVPTDTIDYTSATATAEINVAQATPVITWANAADITYGTALSGTQLDATANVPGTFTYAPAAGTVLGAGMDQTLSVSFVPADTTDYTSATATAEINVAQTTPVITWANPADIAYGTALSGTQLDATANVPGTFTYAPAAGTVPGAGTDETLSVSFVPADMEDYTDAKATAEINVAQATPVITWANPASITYGTALCGTQLDATANVPGTFTYAPAAGTVLGAGDNQTLSVSFVPADAADYTDATATAEISVAQATPVITWANPADITYGTSLSGTQLDAAANVPGTFTYAPAAGTVLGAGDNQTLSVSFVPTDTADYTDATATAEINVAQATLTITASNESKVYGSALSLGDTGFTAVGLVNSDVVTGVTLTSAGAAAAATVAAPGPCYAIVPSAAQGRGLGNYVISYVNGQLTVNPRVLTITVTGVNKIYDATTAATVILSDDRVPGDTFTDSYTSASFTNKNVGTGITVSVSGISISGPGAANYTFDTSALTWADITPAPLTITAATNTKVYDGTTSSAASPTVSGLQGSDTLSNLTETYATADVGTGITLVVATYAVNDGNSGNDYTVTLVANNTGVITSASSSGGVTALGLPDSPPTGALAGAVFGFTVNLLNSQDQLDMSYDGSVTVSLANNPGGSTLGGELTVQAAAGTATFSGLTISNPGLGYTLQISAPGINTVTTSSIDVTGYQLVNNGATEDLDWFGTSGSDDVRFTQTAAGTVQISVTEVIGIATGFMATVTGVTGDVVVNEYDISGDTDVVDCGGLTTISSVITVGNGNDTIIGGGGANTIIAGNGNNTIYGNGIGNSPNGSVEDPSNTITVGNGHNIIYGNYGGSGYQGGNNTITAGDGNNTIYGNYGNGGYTGDGAEGSDNTITVGNGANTIYGNYGNADGGEGGSNTIVAGNGNDIIYGNADGDDPKHKQGNNFIQVGNGNDTIYGNLGGDGGEGGDNTILTGSGQDTIYGNFGGDGGEGGNNLIVAGGGNDIIYAHSGLPATSTTSGTTAQGRDVIVGGTGADTILGWDPSYAVGTNTGDLFIAGTTNLSVSALKSILGEWDSADSYTTRIADISGQNGTAGANGGNYLIPNQTVFSNPPTVVDQISGTIGTVSDWYLVTEGQDVLTNVNSGATITVL